MTELPEPLTPPECDLRGMPYMPLDLIRLFDSDLYALSNGDEFKAALTLWGKSFYQVPAGSLPSDDRLLEHLSGSKRWKAVREMALRGWVKCSDGRLYHKTVAEKVKEAWASRLARRERTEAARAARHKASAASDTTPTPPVTTSVTDNVTTSVTESKGTEQNGTEQNGTEDKKEREKEPPLAPPTETPHRAADASPQKTATRLPADWDPGPDEREFALGLGLPVERIAAKFRDYWTAASGQNARKHDWPATWRNWCRREAENPRNRILPPRDQRAADRDANQREIERLERELFGQPKTPAAFDGITIEGTLQ